MKNENRRPFTFPGVFVQDESVSQGSRMAVNAGKRLRRPDE